jgi:hypothetical protein
MRSLFRWLKLLSLGVLTAVFLNACRQESYWERTLAGPFQGDPFNGQLTTQPASSLQVPPRFVLDVHWESSTNDPIIRLREDKGTSLWARVLVPRLQGQEQPRGRITTLTLNEVKTVKDGFKVMLSCDWTGGGKEGGIIYLNTNHTFRNFALGW